MTVSKWIFPEKHRRMYDSREMSTARCYADLAVVSTGPWCPRCHPNHYQGRHRYTYSVGKDRP